MLNANVECPISARLVSMIWVKDQRAQAQQWLMHAQARAQAQHWIMHAQARPQAQAQAQLQRKRRLTLAFNIERQPASSRIRVDPCRVRVMAGRIRVVPCQVQSMSSSARVVPCRC